MVVEAQVMGEDVAGAVDQGAAVAEGVCVYPDECLGRGDVELDGEETRGLVDLFRRSGRRTRRREPVPTAGRNSRPRRARAATPRVLIAMAVVAVRSSRGQVMRALRTAVAGKAGTTIGATMVTGQRGDLKCRASGQGGEAEQPPTVVDDALGHVPPAGDLDGAARWLPRTRRPKPEDRRG
ncbi:hypothetical protein [Amycolatopsis regifaucium]|uniref:hypothetical protein n=1 Tax=Amycolatopsis regifaucium TaxID=546365 RepID=UPI0015A5E007|nr:hypothetical protein [Amycolatopsis regifaucium]